MFEKRIKSLRLGLDRESMIRLRNSAEIAHKAERQWERKLERFYHDLERRTIESLEKTGKVPDPKFDDFYAEHSFDTMAKGYRSAETREGTVKLPRRRIRAASNPARRPPNARIPGRLDDLMEMWDSWRKGRYKPARQKAMGNRIKRAYVKKVQSAWERYSRDFREGDVATQEAARKKIQEAGRATFARAKMIVNTETTHYYNQARRNFYDQSPDVSHYLFVPIRDSATTKWCRTRNRLIYKKGSRHLENETPPIHWNCRSEILPLTKQNPVHLRLINDKSKWRENRRPARLPPGWNRSVTRAA